MKGIRLLHGTVFVTDGLFTVRVLSDGTVESSPISYFVLERDLSTEPPDRWEYITEAEILSLPASNEIRALFDKLNKLTGRKK